MTILTVGGVVAEVHPKSSERWSRFYLRSKSVPGLSGFWCVAKFGVIEGETIEFTCVKDEKYKSYNVLELVINKNPSPAVLALRLSEIAKGIGAVRAANLANVPDLWNQLQTKPEQVAANIGINPEVLQAAVKQLAADQASITRVGELLELGYPKTVAKVAARNDAWYRLALDNPYAIIAYIAGYGWKTAEEVAVKMRIPKDHPSRIRAGVFHYWTVEVLSKGHTRCSDQQITDELPGLLGVDADKVCRAIESELARLKTTEGIWWTTHKTYDAELTIYSRLLS